MLPAKFRGPLWPSGFRGEDFFLSANQKKDLLCGGHVCWPIRTNEKLYRGPSIDASYQVSVHLAKQFQRRRFLEIDQSETRIACGSHVC